ncbi:hypothetical protein NBRC116494_24350 [Aurantivibrio plasticivorans]
MTQATTFKSWLIQPGHHRELKSICSKAKNILQKNIAVQSWQDLYGYFEETVDVDDTHRTIFDPIFKKHPPTKENGATDRQMKIYRGAKPVEIEEPEQKEETRVTYRGQAIIKKRSESRDTALETTARKQRYYRGARVD